MRIIDDNGRLFGKINIIDFTVLLVILSIIALFIFSYLKFRENSRPKEPQARETTELEMDFKLIKIAPEKIPLIMAGDKQIGGNGDVIGEIISLGKPGPYQYIFNMSSTSGTRIGFLTKDDALLKEMPAKLKLKVEVRDLNGAYYNNQQLLFNIPVTFSTEKYSVLAVPIVPAEQKYESWMQIKVKFAGLYPELSNIISKGHIELDSEGRVIGRLKEIASTKPTDVQALKLEENTIAVISDPFRSDVVAILDILCSKMPDGYYYKNYSVKIGSQITFSSELYQVTGIILGVDIKSEDK